MNRLMHIAGCVAAAVFVAVAASGQTRATTADLTGVVYDQSRGVLPGVTVSATNSETNHTRSTVTDAVGRFTIPALPPGVYTARAELTGFAPQSRQDVELQLGTQVALEFTL